jgi:alpha-tubulin suppressor-like RCC1 family protein
MLSLSPGADMCTRGGRRDSPQLGLGNGSDNEIDGIDTDHVDCGIPVLITALLGKHVRAVAVATFTSCAMTDTGALHPWGDDRNGNLGHGDVRERNVPALV